LLYRIILIDDEPWALAGLRKIFKWHEKLFEIVAETTNPIEALDLIRSKKPDAVFTDIRMPDISGIDLMKIIRSEGLDTEFVIISGFAEFSYAQKSIRLGAFDYCLKPLHLKEADTLIKTLWEFLEQKGQRLKNNNEQKDIPVSGTGEYINPDFLELLAYINIHFPKKLYLSSLAEKFHLNPTYCSELFKKTTEKTFSEYLSELRIGNACRLMELTCMSIEQIAYKTGFNDYNYFNKVFKKITGQTPLKYRKEKVSEDK
jgi:YesN/AraC family two-component response regulator